MNRLRTFLPGAVAMALLLTGLSAVGTLHAQQELKGIGDPTRPPAGVGGSNGKQTAGTPGAAAPAASGASSPEGEAEKPKPIELTLQAIRFDVGSGLAVAMINDELVQVGDKVEGMSVVSISRNVAVLKGPAGLRRLALLLEPHEMARKPEIDKGRTAKSGRKESK